MGSDNKKSVDRSRRSKDRISRSHKEEKEKGGSSVSSGEYPPSTSGSRYKSHSGAGGGGEDGSVSSHSSALLISKYKSRPIKPKKESDPKSGAKSGSFGWFKFAMILIFMMALWVGVYFGKIDTVAAVKAVTGSKESASKVTERKVEVEKEANESDKLNEKVSEEEADDPDAALAALASGSGNSLWESTLKKNDASDRDGGAVESSKETSKSNAEEDGESEGTEIKMDKQKKVNKLEGTEEVITTDDKEEGEVVQVKESFSSSKRSGKSEFKQDEDQEVSESGGKEDRYRSEERDEGDEGDPMPKKRSRTSTAQEDEVNSRTIITSKENRGDNADEEATVGTKNLRGSLVSKEVDKADSREFEVTSNDEESGAANEKVRTRINDLEEGDAQVVDISREETREQVRDEGSSITIRTEDEDNGSDQETVTASNGKQRVVTRAGDAEEDEGQKDEKSRSINSSKEMSKQEKSVNEKIVLSEQNQSDEGENINVDQSPDEEMRQSKGKIQNQQGEEIEAQGNEVSTSQEESQSEVESTGGEEIQGKGSRSHEKPVINDLDESGLAERRGASNPDKEQIRKEQEEESQGKEDELSDQEVASSRKSSIKLDEGRDETDESPNESQRKQSIVVSRQQQDEDEQE